MKVKAKSGFQEFKKLVEGPATMKHDNRVDKKINRKSVKLFLKEDITPLEYDYVLRFLSVLPEIEETLELNSTEEYEKDLFYRMYRRPIFNVK
jgi:predicted nucleotidyltransferase